MRTFTIGWLNKCRCGNKSHAVKTARGNESALWDDDAVKCNSCGRGGVIQVCEGQARVLWETDEEMAEGKPMSTLTKEWLLKTIAELEEEHDATPGAVNEDAAMALAAMKLALASLESGGEACEACGGNGSVDIDHGEMGIEHIECPKCYTAPPAPVSVLDERYQQLSELYHAQEKRLFKLAQRIKGQSFDKYAHSPSQAIDVLESAIFGECEEDCRAAMHQGADGKPELTVWYGAMPETNGKTNWTAMLHRKGHHPWEGITIDRSEYPGRVRYEADRMRHLIGELADEPDILAYDSDAHSGYVEPVTTAYKFRDAVEIIRNSGIEIDAEKIFAERDVLNTPNCRCRTCRPVTVTDMRFVVCPDCGNKRCPHANDHRNACTGSNEPGQEGSAYPAAPQQEVTQALAKGMERYGDAMQELAKKEVK